MCYNMTLTIYDSLLAVLMTLSSWPQGSIDWTTITAYFHHCRKGPLYLCFRICRLQPPHKEICWWTMELRFSSISDNPNVHKNNVVRESRILFSTLVTWSFLWTPLNAEKLAPFLFSHLQESEGFEMCAQTYNRCNISFKSVFQSFNSLLDNCPLGGLWCGGGVPKEDPCMQQQGRFVSLPRWWTLRDCKIFNHS